MCTLFPKDVYSVLHFCMIVASPRQLRLGEVSNQWETDPLSLGDAKNAIASRYDLSTSRPTAGGAIDAKVLSAKQQADSPLRFMAVNGPTSDDQPAWSFTGADPSTARHGLVDLWNFTWIVV